MTRVAFPALTPTYGLGSYGRTAAAILVGSPRTTIASQGRIYAWYNRRGQGQQYKQYLLKCLGRMPVTNNLWTIM